MLLDKEGETDTSSNTPFLTYSLTFTYLNVDITAPGEQHLDTLLMLFVHGHMQSAAASIVQRVNLGSLLKKLVHHFWLIAVERDHSFHKLQWTRAKLNQLHIS